MKKLVLPAYDFVIKGAHAFNVLDARGAIGVTERQRYILRVRTLARASSDAADPLAKPLTNRSNYAGRAFCLGRIKNYCPEY